MTGRLTEASPPFDFGYVGPSRFAHENPNPQYVRRGDRPVAEVLVTMDLSKLEERVMAQLEPKGDIAEALRKALVLNKKDRHKM